MDSETCRKTKYTNTDSKVLYVIFFRNSMPLIQIAVLKGRGMSGSFYKECGSEKKCDKKKGEKYVQKPVSNMSICFMTILQPTNS